MNAIYNGCSVDPWLDISQVLKEKYNIIPAYWIGFNNDNSREIIPRIFPQALYHEYFDAWKGVFPEKVEKIAKNYCVDIDFYRDISNNELLGLSLMDRMDEDQHSFGFLERRNLFRKILRYWMAIIDFYKIDILINPFIPHLSFDYPLYLLCKKKGIKIFTTLHTPFSSAGRFIGVDNIDNLPSKIHRDYKRLKDGKKNFQLADDIVAYLDVVKKKYEDAKPANFKEFNRFHKKKPSIIQTGKKFLYELSNKRSVWFGKQRYLLDGVPKYRKESKKNVEKSRTKYKLLPYSYIIYKRVRFLKALEKEYSNITIKPDFAKPFAFFAMHYQPEATSMPIGGIFYDQLYVIELLSRYIPREWNIYIKENPYQFNPRGEGATCRLLRFYRDALKFPRVYFIPVDTNPFMLIDQAKVVITIAGTTGWEAMVRKKPVICFGQSWYESFTDGVFRIRDNQDMEKIVNFIRNYKYSEKKLLSYLKAIELNSRIAYKYFEFKEKIKVSKIQSINEFVDCVASHFQIQSSGKNH